VYELILGAGELGLGACKVTSGADELGVCELTFEADELALGAYELTSGTD